MNFPPGSVGPNDRVNSLGECSYLLRRRQGGGQWTEREEEDGYVRDLLEV